MPALSAPASVTGERPGCTASVPAQPGLGYRWSILNGVLTSPANEASVTFTPGDAGSVELSCCLVNAAGQAGPPATIACPILPVAKCDDTVFLAHGLPYLQLGPTPAASCLALLWLTPGDVEQDWAVDVFQAGAWVTQPRTPSSRWQTLVAVPDEPVHRVHTQILSGLVPGEAFHYRLRLGARVVFQNRGQALKTATQPQRVTVVGDLVSGDRTIPAVMARQIFQNRPDLLVVPGDIVNLEGHANQYRDAFFKPYNAGAEHPGQGAPLLREIPLAPCLGNNDTDRVGERRGAPVPIATPKPNGLAYYYYFSMPLNGPLLTLNASGTLGHGLFTANTPAATHAAFLAAAGPRYLRMGNYSFDAGNVHWVVLDSCRYGFMTWQNAALEAWLEADLAAAGATWKFVVFHHPLASNSSFPHGEYWMRQYLPLFNRHQVALTFSGHLHSYHRSRPLRFAPKPDWQPFRDYLGDTTHFTEDPDFGTGTPLRTQAQGTIAIVTGAGGAHLRPGNRMRSDGRLPTPLRFIDNAHSFSQLDIDGNRLEFRQISSDGTELDHFVLTR